MAKVVNVIGKGSNVGKTILMEGLINELKNRGLTVSTIKHDVHGFDIDKKGKDTYRHRQAGAETVVISSKNRFAMIRELEQEINLDDIIKMVSDKDVVLVEGYKKSDLRKIEVYREGVSEEILTPKEKLIAIASNEHIKYSDVPIVKKDDYKVLADLVQKEKEFKFEK
ncbi:molybdopterin-guanine dinucleotide biosynthesis protein B [Clostridium sp. NSJ-49]|uniref:molybdopterin-guanine dinucleotide biosynthesis protein B n=1 Tax=Clostridium TaxID=1485 RepID=UPI0006DC87F7|nr:MULTISPECIES: molybdopterin-guanine dinucleotide biosynthesis protein B [Clostridium]MBC5624584.1 molybdopterin-guanine dinucleotide biosynthesis protein B [Clostridium sp. NSJ-49]MCD2500709.1 molybdopterin-guanine dinucleotide biosynthesis protein B [Clostridium sp. NSJ-145]MDU6341583.1 molybdopterin-guanine dinucleotide biosynthesis protein B [Clostridium sp.]